MHRSSRGITQPPPCAAYSVDMQWVQVVHLCLRWIAANILSVAGYVMFATPW
jgi:hypothetical protein